MIGQRQVQADDAGTVVGPDRQGDQLPAMDQRGTMVIVLAVDRPLQRQRLVEDGAERAAQIIVKGARQGMKQIAAGGLGQAVAGEIDDIVAVDLAALQEIVGYDAAKRLHQAALLR